MMPPFFLDRYLSVTPVKFCFVVLLESILYLILGKVDSTVYQAAFFADLVRNAG